MTAMPAISLNFAGLRLAGAALVLTLASVGAHAQNGPIKDTSALHPPAGARVAIVEFVDLECPQCAKVAPQVKKAAEQYHIPLVRHDFLIPNHIWSPKAALNARWFESKAKGLGDEYRDYVFANQQAIYNENVLYSYTQKFAQSHGQALPFALDPQGKLQGQIQGDNDLARRMGLSGTPSIFVVAEHSKGAPYTEIPIDLHNLYQAIDQALADTKGPVPAAKTPVTKKPVAKK